MMSTLAAVEIVVGSMLVFLGLFGLIASRCGGTTARAYLGPRKILRRERLVEVVKRLPPPDGRRTYRFRSVGPWAWEADTMYPQCHRRIFGLWWQVPAWLATYSRTFREQERVLKMEQMTGADR